MENSCYRITYTWWTHLYVFCCCVECAFEQEKKRPQYTISGQHAV